MYDAQECRSKAEHYEVLAQASGSIRERDRLLRMKRSYDLMTRSAEFTVSLDDFLQTLKR